MDKAHESLMPQNLKAMNCTLLLGSLCLNFSVDISGKHLVITSE